MQEKIRAVFFDLDGTVVDTMDFHVQAWERLADENGWEFDSSKKDDLRGLARKTIMEMILRKNGIELEDEEKEELSELKNSYYQESIRKIGKRDLVPGAVRFIEKIRKTGRMTGLCSSSKSAQIIADRLDLEKLFHVHVTGWDITAEKPDPQIYRIAAEKLVVSPRVCIVIEDSPNGIEAARAAGMGVIALGRDEKLNNADVTVDGYDNIPWEDIFYDEE